MVSSRYIKFEIDFEVKIYVFYYLNILGENCKAGFYTSSDGFCIECGVGH